MMTKEKYRTLNASCVPVFVENTSNYKRMFVRTCIGDNSVKVPQTFESDECEPMRLFKVLLPDDTAKYVLACNEQRAIGQACCGHPCENRQEFEERCFALRVPLRIQGWSSEEV
jgi:hypothetical protein